MKSKNSYNSWRVTLSNLLAWNFWEICRLAKTLRTRKNWRRKSLRRRKLKRRMAIRKRNKSQYNSKTARDSRHRKSVKYQHFHHQSSRQAILVSRQGDRSPFLLTKVNQWKKSQAQTISQVHLRLPAAVWTSPNPTSKKFTSPNPTNRQFSSRTKRRTGRTCRKVWTWAS